MSTKEYDHFKMFATKVRDGNGNIVDMCGGDSGLCKTGSTSILFYYTFGKEIT